MRRACKLTSILLFLIYVTSTIISLACADTRKSTVITGVVGSGDGQVRFKVEQTDGPYEAVPSSIATDSTGNVYIADIANNRIQKYNGNGQFLSNINFEIIKKRYYKIIDDMYVDVADNLYAASGHEQKIYKFDTNGKQLQSMNLQDKDLCWNSKKGWFRCPIQIEKIILDRSGNIYLQGRHELIKMDSNGNVEKKWNDIRIFFLDEADDIFLNREEIWEKFDKVGNSLGIVKCEKPYFRVKNSKCNYSRFVDKNGFMYFYEETQPEGKGVIIKVDKKGKEYGKAPFEFFKKLQKFDEYGNLYSFGYKDDKFWVEKITWN